MESIKSLKKKHTHTLASTAQDKQQRRQVVMARGIMVPSFQLTNNSSQFILTSFSGVSSTIKSRYNSNPLFASNNKLPFSRVFCNCSNSIRNYADPLQSSHFYTETFSKKMALAGLEPHHRIGIVPFPKDSVCVCVFCVVIAGTKIVYL